MNEEVGPTVSLLAGVMLLRLRLSGAYKVYVKASMGRWLLLAGILLVLLGVTGLVRWGRARRTAGPVAHEDDHDDGHGHGGHGHGVPRVALLLVVPIIAVFLVEPAPLGAFAASRAAARVPPKPVASGPGDLFDPLPAAVDGVTTVNLQAYVGRADYDGARYLGDRPLRLIGFVVPAPAGDPESFLLTRMVIACCAADGFPVQVAVMGAPQVPAKGTWVDVVGTFAAGGDVLKPNLAATSVVETSQPSNPYD